MLKENLKRWNDNKIVERGKRRNTYLTFVNVESVEKLEKNRSFQPATWLFFYLFLFRKTAN